MTTDEAAQMRCGRCTEESRKNGCSYCGGFGVIAERYRCSKCSTEYWLRPYPMSVYEGKQFHGFCGRALQYQAGSTVCRQCAEPQMETILSKKA